MKRIAKKISFPVFISKIINSLPYVVAHDTETWIGFQVVAHTSICRGSLILSEPHHKKLIEHVLRKTVNNLTNKDGE